MPTYTYKAITSKGLIIKNRVDSVSRQQLAKTLKKNNLLPISIEEIAYKSKNLTRRKKNISDVQEIMKKVNTTDLKATKEQNIKITEKINLYLAKNERITTKDITIFTQNFYLLKKANFNNIHALTTLIENTDNLSFKGVLEDILAGVEAGENMYTTMEYYSDIFPYIYINMIKVGELSGSLTNSLEQAVKYLDESTALTKKVRSILLPNIIQFVLLIVMLLVGTLVAIPAIQKVFDEVGTTEQLPAITIWFSNFLDTLVEYWYIPTLLILAIVGGIIAYINTPKGKYNFHRFKYKMPIFGELIFAIDFSRLMRAMLLNLQNGMRIQDAIDVSKNVVQNLVLMNVIEEAINSIIIGSSWIEPFKKSGFCTPMMIEMLEIGMKTDLQEMMEKLVEYMDIDIDNIMNKIMKALPQIVYAIVGAVLIFFVLVVLVPCVQIYMGQFLFSAYGV